MQSQKLLAQAEQFIPGGVNSPVRAFKGVGGYPVFFQRGEGAYLFDEDHRRYVDYVNSWGAVILGHAHPDITRAVQEQAEYGLSFGASHKLEIAMAKKLCHWVPSLEKVRMTNSGTEACMSAIRLARGYTGRNKIIKFAGGYHGHADALLANAGSGLLTLGIPSSPGVPQGSVEHTLTAQYNDLESVGMLYSQYPKDIAAIIVEPVTGNMNCIAPVAGFLEGLREFCDRYNSLLIFDEVMTGFRVALSGAQALLGVIPDLTTLGKVIGGGLPVGALGGRQVIMDHLAPLGSVYQAGTLSGNPLVMAAGLAALSAAEAPGFYKQCTEYTAQLMQEMQLLAKQYRIPLYTEAVGAMFGFLFPAESGQKISNYVEVQNCNLTRFSAFFHGMLEEGIYFAPSAFEAGFVSQAHDAETMEQTLVAADKVFSRLAQLP